MPHEKKMKNQFSPTHPGAKEQREDYNKFRRGGHTSRPTIPEGLHPQDSAEIRAIPTRPK